MSAFDLAPASSQLLLIDVQERFLAAVPSIAADQPVGRACRILTEGARLLGVATTVTEQVPDKLGATLPFLAAAAGDAPRLAKSHFSCLGDAAIAARIDGLARSHAVLCGIETHVCVLSTAADLRARGLQVVVAGDAVASRDPRCAELALGALRDLGCLVLPVEAILFRWQRQAGVGCFKDLSRLVR